MIRIFKEFRLHQQGIIQSCVKQGLPQTSANREDTAQGIVYRRQGYKHNWPPTDKLLRFL